MLAFAVPRRLTAVLVLVASLGTLAWLWFGESDEQRIIGTVAGLAHAVSAKQGESFTFRAARLNGAFKDSLEPDVTLDVPELKRAQGTRELVELGAAAPRLFGDFEIDMDDVRVEIDAAAKQARATGRATLSGSEDGEARRETRDVTFHLVQKGSDWLVHGIQVAPRTYE